METGVLKAWNWCRFSLWLLLWTVRYSSCSSSLFNLCCSLKNKQKPQTFSWPYRGIWRLGIAGDPLKLLPENCLEMFADLADKSLKQRSLSCSLASVLALPQSLRLYLHLQWSKARCIFRQCLNRHRQNCLMLSHGDKSDCTEDCSLVRRAHLGIAVTQRACWCSSCHFTPEMLSNAVSSGCVCGIRRTEFI